MGCGLRCEMRADAPRAAVRKRWRWRWRDRCDASTLVPHSRTLWSDVQRASAVLVLVLVAVAR